MIARGARTLRIVSVMAGLCAAALLALPLAASGQAVGRCGANLTRASACQLQGRTFTAHGFLLAKSQSYLTNEHDYYRFHVSGPTTLRITIINLTKPACSDTVSITVGYVIGCGYVKATLQTARGRYIDSTLPSTPENGHKVAQSATANTPGAGNYYVVVTGQLAQGLKGTENTLYLLKVKKIQDPIGTSACHVPAIKHERLALYKIRLQLSGCRVGPVRYRARPRLANGRVISVAPAPGRSLPAGKKVTIYVAKG